MNYLRERFCKETNVVMGLDCIYKYCKWLEENLNEANDKLKSTQTDTSKLFYCQDEYHDKKEQCIEQCITCFCRF